VEGTLAETGRNPQRGRGVCWLIEQELLGWLEREREDLLDRLAMQLLEDCGGDFERARECAQLDLGAVEHLLVNHAEAVV
jgi:hypothetical protein